MKQDCITITQLETPTIIGVHAYEKQQPQMVLTDIIITLPEQNAHETDQLCDTIDYSKVAEEARSFCWDHHFDLLEKLAEELCQYLLARFPCRSITLTISKPEALLHCQTVSLTITRQASSKP